MKKLMLVALTGALVLGCNNGEAELAKAEAEKAKMELELVKARAEAEVAKAKAQSGAESGTPAPSDMTEAQEAPLKEAKDEAVASAKSAEAKKELAELGAKAKTRSCPPGDPLCSDSPAEESTVFVVKPKVTVSVRERKSDGKSWDAMGGAPDVLVTLSAPGGSVQSGVAKDQYNASFSLGALKLKSGDMVRITVVDKDAMQNDPIGSGQTMFASPGLTAQFGGGSMTGTIQF